MKRILFLFLGLIPYLSNAQIKVLFDATKAEMAGNADWVIDADVHDISFDHGTIHFNGNESDPQRYPTPSITDYTSASENDWTGGISAWGIETAKLNWIPETLPVNGRITYRDNTNDQDLSKYDIFVIVEPNFLFTAEEKTAILDFIYHGGSLFLISDHEHSDRDGDGHDSVDVWEDFLDNNSLGYNPFGIHVNHENFTEGSEEIAYLHGNPILYGNYGDVTRVEFYAGTSFTVDHTENQEAMALVFRKNYLNNNEKVMIASSSYGSGKILAVGDSSIVDDGTGDPHDHLYDGWIADANGNHRRLIMNAMLWMGGESSSVEQVSFSFFKVYVKNHSLIVYPKKVTNFKRMELILYNSSGAVVFTADKWQAQYLLPKNLSKGFYIYCIKKEGQILQKGKIIL